MWVIIYNFYHYIYNNKSNFELGRTKDQVYWPLWNRSRSYRPLCVSYLLFKPLRKFSQKKNPLTKLVFSVALILLTTILFIISCFFLVRGFKTACCPAANPSQAQPMPYYPNFMPPSRNDQRYYSAGHPYASGQAWSPNCDLRKNYLYNCNLKIFA